MKIGMSLGMRGQRGLTQIQRAIAFLRSLGTNAHVWLPGANGVSVASLPSNNYLLSDGSTGYSTVDGVDGLTLDGMGALGAELIPTYDFTTYGVAGGVSARTANSFTTTSGGGVLTVNGLISLGLTYAITVTGTTTATQVYLRNPGTLTNSTAASTGAFTLTLTCAWTDVANIYLQNTTAGFTTITSFSCKPYTGTHLTQATSANKPLVRRGMLNELLNSATPATQSVTCIAAPYTLALYGTGNVVLSGTGAGTLTGTGASDLVVLNFTPTAGSVTFTKAGTVSSFGLFKGTWTAAQILAEGGIPPTTATAASNPSAGKYWWSFNHADVVAPDNLLSGNLAITNAVTIVIAGRVNSLATINYLLGEDTNGVQVCININGSLSFGKVTIADILVSSAGQIVAGVPFVITVRLSGGTAVFRLNGVQIATVATVYTFSATTGARIGMKFNSTLPLNGALGWVVPLTTALSDADCLTVERLVGQQFPGMATF